MTSVKAKSPNGWSLKQGLAAQYGAQAGLDPDLAASAGEAGWDVLKSLRDAVDERDPARRATRVKQTQKYLAKASLGRELVRAIQQRLAALNQADRAQPSINPETGLQEFFANQVNDAVEFGKRNMSFDFSRNALDKNNSDLGAAVEAQKQLNTYYGKDKLSPNELTEFLGLRDQVRGRLNPSGINIGDHPQTRQEIEDLYKIQDINIQNYRNARPVPFSQLEGFTPHVSNQFKNEDGSLQDAAVTRYLISTNPGILDTHFIDHEGIIRDRDASAGVLLNQPMHPVAKEIENWYERELPKHYEELRNSGALTEGFERQLESLKPNPRPSLRGGGRVPK